MKHHVAGGGGQSQMKRQPLAPVPRSVQQLHSQVVAVMNQGFASINFLLSSARFRVGRLQAAGKS